MSYMDKGLVELHELLKNGEVTSDELVKESIAKSHEVQDKYNAFVTILDDAKGGEVTDNILSAIPYGVKDNYSTKGILSTGSSNTLKDYVPFFNATAIDKLNAAGAVKVNKTVLDEFGMGGTGTTGHTGIVKNPWDPTRMCAGSSSGSACAVAAGVYPYATGSDTGDSIRKPAAYCGIVGYKPTYGMISRYGLFAFASSLDHCGVLTRCVEDAAIVTDNMKGIDKYDMTSWDSSSINLYKDLTDDVKGKKLCYIKEICNPSMYPNAGSELKEHLDNFYTVVDKCKELGMTVDEVSVDSKLLNALAAVYVVISCAEATSNMSNLTGIIFGPRSEGENYIDMMTDYRTKGFSPLIKRRLIIGSYALMKENQEEVFVRAQRYRHKIVASFNKLFEEYDFVMAPASPTTAPLIDSSADKLSSEYLIAENFMAYANFGGYPSLTLPLGMQKGLPFGVNITSKPFTEETLFRLANNIEDITGYYNLNAKAVD